MNKNKSIGCNIKYKYEFRKDFINDFKSYIPKYFKNIIFAIFDNLIILLENQ